MKNQIIDFLDKGNPQTLPEIDSTRNEEKKQLLQKLISTQHELETKVSQDIEFAAPIIELNGKPIIFLNTLNVTQGQTGSHKSRLAELLTSRILSRLPEKNYLGFKRKNFDSKNYHVGFIDTERNLQDQFPYSMQQIIQKAGFEKGFPPTNFNYTSLVSINRKERFTALRLYVEHLRDQYPDKHLIIVLDVVTDCVSSFNNEADSLVLIDLLNSMINESNATFICVIHENPGSGSNKARGHLGSELMHKASTQIQISFDGSDTSTGTELYKVKFLKTRRTCKPMNFHVYFSQEESGLLVADENMVENKETKTKKKLSPKDVKKFILENLFKKISRTELMTDLKNHFNVGQTTIINLLKEIVDNQSIIEEGESKIYFRKNSPRKTSLF